MGREKERGWAGDATARLPRRSKDDWNTRQLTVLYGGEHIPVQDLLVDRRPPLTLRILVYNISQPGTNNIVSTRKYATLQYSNAY